MTTQPQDSYEIEKQIFELAEKAGFKIFMITKEDFNEENTEEDFSDTQINKLQEYALDYICEEWLSVKDDAIQKLKAKKIN